MGLHDLRQVHDPAQLDCRLRDDNGHQRVTGFGRGHQVADRANTADARRQRGHFVEWAALAELLEAAHLRHVEARVRNLALRVKLDRDLGVSFDARYRIDNYFSLHSVLLSFTRQSVYAHWNRADGPLTARSGRRKSYPPRVGSLVRTRPP